MINGFTNHMLRRKRSANTIRLRLFYVNKFWEWFGHDLETAKHEDLEAYIYADANWSQNTQQAATASLRAFYNWATREGHLEHSPARDLPSVTVHRRRPRIASEPAIARAITCDSLTDRAMILLGAECGLRVSEIAGLSLNHRSGSWLHVIGKGNKQRSLALSPELAALLDEIETTTMRWGYYFPGRKPRRHIHASTAWKRITTVLESNPHSLRRRAGTIVYRNSGKDIRLAQVFLGHAQASTTEAYLDVQDDDLAKAALLTRVAA